MRASEHLSFVEDTALSEAYLRPRNSAERRDAPHWRAAEQEQDVEDPQQNGRGHHPLLLRSCLQRQQRRDANLSAAAQYIANNNSSFSCINYGYRKISDLIKATDMFEMKRRDGAAIYLRDKRAA